MNALKVLLILLVAASPIGCADAGEQEVVTETIQPASPPPSPPGDDAAVLTQTTEIGEERSPNEGGILTNPTGAEINGRRPVTRGSPPPATATSTQPRQPEQ